ncbi:MAG: amidase [Mycetocola sp.]|jgi:aspartyl-tRNA(Asn)/glutamyl-tRNA(Gln) amidotransferase subunit A|nr:amidase [Mycetocola sp.]
MRVADPDPRGLARSRIVGNESDTLVGVGPFSGESITALSARIRNKGITSRQLTDLALEAAAIHNKRLNCFVTMDPEGARRAAEDADRELSDGHDRGPLHGIPVAVKDIIATNGLKTAMGSRHFEHHVPQVDADAVRALRRAGAIIVGKTHAHQFAFGPTGDRAATGPSLNPHDLGRVTGGSSGGSAAAVAAGLVPLALGTDTAGSVRIPAAFCGTVGLRPTFGSVPVGGVFPLSPSLDVVGLIASSVADTAIAWWALSSRADSIGSTLPAWTAESAPEPTRALRARFSTVGSALTQRAAPGPAKAIRLAVDALHGIGAIVSHVALPEVDECAAPHQAIQSSEAYAIHEARVRTAPDQFEPEILQQLQSASAIRGWEYVQALALRDSLRSRALEALSSIDILILPTVPVDAPMIGQRELSGDGGWTSTREALKSFTVPWSLLDLPAISVPIRIPGERMPCGIQLVGKPGLERPLLDAAALLEIALTKSV